MKRKQTRRFIAVVPALLLVGCTERPPGLRSNPPGPGEGILPPSSNPEPEKVKLISNPPGSNGDPIPPSSTPAPEGMQKSFNPPGTLGETLPAAPPPEVHTNPPSPGTGEPKTPVKVSPSTGGPTAPPHKNPGPRPLPLEK